MGDHRISIHALLAESDCTGPPGAFCTGNFNPRSPCGERRGTAGQVLTKTAFQSTLSLRRATWPGNRFCTFFRFQSTLSLRRATFRSFSPSPREGISIHALLAESDTAPVNGAEGPRISIHALLAESDVRFQRLQFLHSHFNPRSPCGERLSALLIICLAREISIHALLAESDSKYHQIGPIVSV